MLNVLWPLRTESILTLASAHTADLGQSYERTRVFAGKLASGGDAGRDWAPIYLSDQLVDTEVGSLLNLTDQILKSWSQAGQVDYDNFPIESRTLFRLAIKLCLSWRVVAERSSTGTRRDSARSHRSAMSRSTPSIGLAHCPSHTARTLARSTTRSSSGNCPLLRRPPTTTFQLAAIHT